MTHFLIKCYTASFIIEVYKNYEIERREAFYDKIMFENAIKWWLKEGLIHENYIIECVRYNK